MDPGVLNVRVVRSERKRERRDKGLKEKPGAEFLKGTDRVLVIGFICRRN